MTNDVLLYLIYTDDEIQDAFPACKTSLGPWCLNEVTEYLQQEYPLLQPSAHEQVAMLLSGVETVRTLSWRLRTAT